MKFFVPLTKVDATRQEVTGILTEEAPDKRDEILDYQRSKPHIVAWSEEIFKASKGKSRGNLRAMHGDIAAGKITAIDFLDEERKVRITAKVVDPVEWRKVAEGVYTGFSIGGDYVDRWPDKESGGKFVRYEAKPFEASLADNPAQFGSVFEMIKSDGARVLCKRIETADGGVAVQFFPEDQRMAKAKGKKKAVEEGSSDAGKVVVALKSFIIENGLFDGDPALMTYDQMVEILNGVVNGAKSEAAEGSAVETEPSDAPDAPVAEAVVDDPGENPAAEPDPEAEMSVGKVADGEEKTEPADAEKTAGGGEDTIETLSKAVRSIVERIAEVPGTDEITEAVVKAAGDLVRGEIANLEKTIGERLDRIEKATPAPVGRPVAKTIGRGETAITIEDPGSPKDWETMIGALRKANALTPEAERAIRLGMAQIALMS